MTTKELIQAEIERLSGEELQELYDLIQEFTHTKRRANKRPILAELKSIVIDAPADFAANHDLYAAGERDAGSNSH